MRLLPTILLTAALGGCSSAGQSSGGSSGSSTRRSSTGGGTTGSTERSSSGSSSSGSPFQPAPHQPYDLVPYQDGPVLKPLDVVTVHYSSGYRHGSEELDELLQFDQWIVTSDWLQTVGAQYGVGPGVELGPVDLGAPPPSIDDSAIADIVYQLATDGGFASRANPPLFVFYFPAATTVCTTADDAADAGCGGGWHSIANFSTLVEGGTWPYSVVPDIASQETYLSDIADVEARASHEIIEAATDPFPGLESGWIGALPEQNGWAAFYGEVGDVCCWNYMELDGGYTVQRIWSNDAAADGGDPCVPYPPDDVWYGVSTTPGNYLTATAGSTTQIQLTGWSTAPRSDWYVYPERGEWQDFCPGLGGVFEKDGGCAEWRAVFTVNNGYQTTFALTIPPGVDAGAQASLVFESYDSTGRGNSLWPLEIEVVP